MLFDNINFLLSERGAPSLSGEEFLRLDPDALWHMVLQLEVPFEILNTVDLRKRRSALAKAEIKLLVLDVDGVFTDGGMYYTSGGEEIKKFNVKDGMAITRAIANGLEIGIISAASRSEVVKIRAAILGIERIYVGKKPKLEVLEEWLYNMGIGYENVAYIGDDINDVEILQKVAVSAAPADAVYAARKAAGLVMRARGGEGCIREFIENYVRPGVV